MANCAAGQGAASAPPRTVRLSPGAQRTAVTRPRRRRYGSAMDDASFLLEWLLEQGVSALLRVDAERGARPWTFHASGGPLAGSWVRVDADTAEECLGRAYKHLKKAGVDLP